MTFGIRPFGLVPFGLQPAAASGATAYTVTLSPASFAFTPQTLSAKTARFVTLSPAAYTFSANSLTARYGRNVTLSPASYTFTPQSLTARYGRNVTLTRASFAFSVGDLTATYTAGNVQANYSVTLSPATFSFTPRSLDVLYTNKGGGGRDGHGLKSNNRLPYGWWSDPAYQTRPRSKKPLTEAEKEVIREAVAETEEAGEAPSLAANLLAALVQPYENNDRIDWQAINRSNEEIKALRQGIAQYKQDLQDQAEEAEDEEAILLLAH